MYIYLNGDYIKPEEARISVFDHGYLYGLGVFETFRVYKGHPFLLKDHLARLGRSLSELEIRTHLDFDKVNSIISSLLALNSLQDEDVSVRLNVSAGDGGNMLADQSYENPTVLCFMRKLPQTVAPVKTGKILTVKRNTPEGSFRMKSHHYMNNFFGKKETGNSPLLEGIFLTEKGHVAEGIVSNLFWAKAGKVYTPSLETGILGGITRKFVLTLLKKLHIPFEEGFYTADEMLAADEVFAVNSVQEIVPFKEIETAVLRGREGPMAALLMENYSSCRQKLLACDEL